MDYNCVIVITRRGETDYKSGFNIGDDKNSYVVMIRNFVGSV